MKHKATYLDSGFYTISPRAAGALVRILGQKLPPHGYEKYVMLRTEHGYRLNAWLSRADVRSGIKRQTRSGWIWAIHGIRFDGARSPVILGNAFTFEPIASTAEVAA